MVKRISAMMKPWPKIKVSWLFLPYVLIVIHFHLTTIVSWMFLMILVHEGGHIMVANSYGVKIEKIIIYPFGIVADLANMDDYSTKIEWLIACAGPLFQVGMFILMNICYQYQYLSLHQLNYLQMLNVQLAIFNLLPIFPLDGGRMMRSLFHHFFPYKQAQWLTLVTSLLVFVFVGAFQFVSNPWKVIFLFLYAGYVYHEIQEMELQRLRFYFHRLYQTISYDTKIHTHNDLYRDKSNIIVHKKRRIHEKEWLKRLFHSV